MGDALSAYLQETGCDFGEDVASFGEAFGILLFIFIMEKNYFSPRKFNIFGTLTVLISKTLL